VSGNSRSKLSCATASKSSSPAAPTPPATRRCSAPRARALSTSSSAQGCARRRSATSLRREKLDDAERRPRDRSPAEQWPRYRPPLQEVGWNPPGGSSQRIRGFRQGPNFGELRCHGLDLIQHRGPGGTFALKHLGHPPDAIAAPPAFTSGAVKRADHRRLLRGETSASCDSHRASCLRWHHGHVPTCPVCAHALLATGVRSCPGFAKYRADGICVISPSISLIAPGSPSQFPELWRTRCVGT
jgi:hypothetical protein